jgi:hypothetical protein
MVVGMPPLAAIESLRVSECPDDDDDRADNMCSSSSLFVEPIEPGPLLYPSVPVLPMSLTVEKLITLGALPTEENDPLCIFAFDEFKVCRLLSVRLTCSKLGLRPPDKRPIDTGLPLDSGGNADADADVGPDGLSPRLDNEKRCFC